MKITTLLLAFLLASAAFGKSKHDYQVGTFLGTQLMADGTYTNNIHCSDGDDYTCSGSAGFNTFQAYYVSTDEGVWSFITDRQEDDITIRALGQTPIHWGKEKPNLLDSLKAGDKVAFRISKDHRIGAGSNYHVFIPQADNPNKEEKFEGVLAPQNVPVVASKPVDNIKSMCAAHLFSPEDEKKYCTAQ